MLPDAEMSRILGVAVVGEPDDTATATQCTFQPKSASTWYVEVKITRGDGAVAMSGVGFSAASNPVSPPPMPAWATRRWSWGPAVMYAPAKTS